MQIVRRLFFCCLLVCFIFSIACVPAFASSSPSWTVIAPVSTSNIPSDTLRVRTAYPSGSVLGSTYGTFTTINGTFGSSLGFGVSPNSGSFTPFSLDPTYSGAPSTIILYGSQNGSGATALSTFASGTPNSVSYHFYDPGSGFTEPVDSVFRISFNFSSATYPREYRYYCSGYNFWLGSVDLYPIGEVVAPRTYVIEYRTTTGSAQSTTLYNTVYNYSNPIPYYGCKFYSNLTDESYFEGSLPANTPFYLTFYIPPNTSAVYWLDLTIATADTHFPVFRLPSTPSGYSVTKITSYVALNGRMADFDLGSWLPQEVMDIIGPSQLGGLSNAGVYMTRQVTSPSTPSFNFPQNEDPGGGGEDPGGGDGFDFSWDGLSDVLTGLFVPSSSEFSVMVAEWETLLTARFGAISQAPPLIVQFFKDIASYISSESDNQDTYYFHFPGIKFSMLGKEYVILDEQSVSLENDYFTVVSPYLGFIVTVICCLAIMNLLFRWWRIIYDDYFAEKVGD